jgi:hypothetical protein
LLRKEYEAQHSTLAALQEEQRKLDDKLKADYGPEHAFLALHDKCVELKVNQYTYEVRVWRDERESERERVCFTHHVCEDDCIRMCALLALL